MILVIPFFFFTCMALMPTIFASSEVFCFVLLLLILFRAMHDLVFVF